MTEHLPSIIVTDPRCVTSLLPHGIASSLLTHHVFAASRHCAPHAAQDGQIAGDSRITGDDYW